MPRQGVPYPGREICSLKCQIDALNAKINELMKSINGVQGDGQGNVSLVSGDPAIVINNDQAQHEIEIALDGSQLPAAAVSSVNGQTGVVDLDGGDIPMYQGQSTPTVQNVVAANAGAISQLQADLNQEVLDRGNADSALQTNVNGIGARVSVIEGQISEDPDPNTIGLRDANGRLRAEDPASGATDKTLVTANWVSQTGDSGPNNLLHKSGDETYTGVKISTGTQRIEGMYGNKSRLIQFTVDTTAYRKVYEFDDQGGAQYNTLTLLVTNRRGQNDRIGIIYITNNRNGSPNATWMIKGGGIALTDFVMTKEDPGTITLWCKQFNGGSDGYHFIRLMENSTGAITDRWMIPTDENAYTITSSGYTDGDGVVHTFTRYVDSVVMS